VNRALKAANAIAKLINENLSSIDADVQVAHSDGRVSLTWESGPFEWAYAVAEYEDIFQGEVGEYGGPMPTWQEQIQVICLDNNVLLEPENSFIINVWED